MKRIFLFCSCLLTAYVAGAQPTLDLSKMVPKPAPGLFRAHKTVICLNGKVEHALIILLFMQLVDVHILYGYLCNIR